MSGSGQINYYSNDGTQIWNYSTTSSIPSLSISADGQYVAAGGRDNRMVYYFSRDGTILWEYITGIEVFQVAASADGRYVAAGSNLVYYFSSHIAPEASFITNFTNGTAPLTVSFTDTSSNNPMTWNWSFRNATGNNTQVLFSTEQNPSYTFGVGNYSIVLNASNSAGYDLSNQVTFINVSAAPIFPVANFTANVTNGLAPLTVKFTDTSTGTGIVTWNWDFNNDGAVDSTVQVQGILTIVVVCIP